MEVIVTLDTGGIFYLLLVAGVGYYADKKGRNPIGWGLAALFFSPLLVVIILAFLKNLKEEQNYQQVLNQQEQINDRISVNEINTNRRFEKIEKKVEEIDRAKSESLSVATVPAALGETGQTSADNNQAAEETYAEKIAENKNDVSAMQNEIKNVAVEGAINTNSKCPYCDSDVPANSKFCGNCGAKL